MTGVWWRLRIVFVVIIPARTSLLYNQPSATPMSGEFKPTASPAEPGLDT